MTEATALSRRAALALVAPLVLASTAHAQPAFPSRPLRILVPFAPGGTTDILARALGERLAAQLGQPAVIDNRAGAGGVVAGETFARAEPDGHTLLVATASLISINKALFATLPFDPDADFLPVAMLAQQPNVLVVNPRAIPATTLPDLIAYLRAHPGTGSQLHLTGEMFRAEANLDLTHIPYRGSGPAMADLIAGNLPMLFDGLGTSLPQIQAGTVRVIATASLTPSPALPGVPTVASVLPGFTSINWTGLFLRRGTPEPIRDRIEVETRAALASPAMRNLYADRAFELFPLTRAELAPYLIEEARRWREAVRRSGATAN